MNFVLFFSIKQCMRYKIINIVLKSGEKELKNRKKSKSQKICLSEYAAFC